MSSSNLTLDEIISGLQTLQSQLAEWRAVVANIEAREKDAAQARVKVRELTEQVAGFESARNAIFAAEAEAKEAEVKAAKRRELATQIREAIARRDSLARVVVELNDEEPLARGTVAGARERLAEHLDSLLTVDDFPTEAEFGEEKLNGEKLQSAYDAAVGAHKAVAERQAKTRIAWLQACDEVSALTWQENRLRPPDPPGTHDLKGGIFTVQ